MMTHATFRSKAQVNVRRNTDKDDFDGVADFCENGQVQPERDIENSGENSKAINEEEEIPTSMTQNQVDSKPVGEPANDPKYRVPYTWPYTKQELYECRDPIVLGEQESWDPYKGMGAVEKAKAKKVREAQIAELVKEMDAMDSTDSEDERRNKKKRKKDA